MRLFATVAALVTTLVLMATSAQAQLFNENFSYTAGTNLTANGWAAHSGGGTNPQTVVSPSLFRSGYASSGIGNAGSLGAVSGEDDNRTFTTTATGTVYLSALVNVTSSSATGDYVLHLAVSPVSTTFSTRLFVKKDASTTNYALGLNHASTAGTVAYTPFSYVPGTTYHVIIKQTFIVGAGNDQLDLFVDPVLGAAEPASVLTFTNTAQADPASVGAVCLRQGSTTPVARFDGIRVGTTWADVASLSTFSITATAGTGGSISPGTVAVNQSDNQTFTITPDPGYGIADVVVDGSSVGTPPSYTFTNVQAAHTIDATFYLLPVNHTITATAGTGGSISPSGAVSVADGADQTFTITVDPCYTLADVVVDGSSVGTPTSYTFFGVTADHTIDATFTANGPYTITSTAGAGGTIAPLGATVVACGDDQSYTITPDPGFSIADVMVDGSSVGTPTNYTFTDVQTNHTIDATFSSTAHTITATAGAGGSISPSGAVTVADGADQTFTITPNACFAIADVLVDGSSVGTPSSYTFFGVTADHTIDATFVQPNYTLSVTVVGNGSVGLSPPGGTYACGTVVTLTATADPGYHFDGWSGDATGLTNPLMVTMSADKNITATFLANVYTWNQTGTASWATAGNWTPTRNTPMTNDVLQFNNGSTTTATGVPTQTIAQLLVSGSTNVTLQAAAAATVLTVGGGTGTDLDVPAGSALNVGGASTLKITVGAGATGSIGGGMTMAGGIHQLDAGSASGVTFQSGSVFTYNPGGSSGNPFTNLGTANAIVFAGGSTYNSQGGANPFGLTAPASKVVFQSGNFYRHLHSGLPSFSGRTYAHFELNAPTYNNTSGGGNPFVCENLLVTSGIIHLQLTNVTIKGNITAAGGTLDFNPTAAAAIGLAGTSVQTITNAAVLTFGSFANVTVNNSSGVVLASNLTLNGNLTFSAGNVTTGANTLAVVGTVSGASQSAGYVVGNLQRTLTGSSATGTWDIGDGSYYTPVDVALSGLTGSLVVRANTSTPDHASLGTSGIDGAQSVNRTWTMTPVGTPTFTSYNATFHFNAADVDGGADPLVFIAERYDGATWSGLTEGTRTATSTQVTGATSFSDFAIGEPNDAASGPSAHWDGPNGGAELIVGLPYALTWTASDNVGVTSVDLYVSRTGLSGPYELIVAGETNDGSYDWTVTGPGTNTDATSVYSAYFRVVAHDGAALTGQDESDANGSGQGVSLYDLATETLVALFEAAPLGDGVELRWQVGRSDLFTGLFVERSESEAGPWTRLGVDVRVVEGVSTVVDRTVEYGRQYHYRLTGETRSGQPATLARLTVQAGVPIADFELTSVGPNPSRGPVGIQYAVAREARVSMTVVDVQGRQVAQLLEGVLRPGRYQAVWSGETSHGGRAPAGIYFIRYQAPAKHLVRRVVLTR